jgi:hypothetical protein
MNGIKEKLTFIATIIGIALLMWILAPVFTSVAAPAIAAPGAADAWGFVWAANNVAALLIIAFVAICVVYIGIQIRKSKRS